MTQGKISVGVQAFLPAAQGALDSHLEAAQQATLKIAVEQYCTRDDDNPARQFLRAQPEVILVDMREERAALKSLHILRSILPAAWLIACSDSNDAELIREAMKTGVREYLVKPISAKSLSLSLNRYIENKKRLTKRTDFRSKTYAIIAPKGGAGASSVAVNLAAALAEVKGADVALLDVKSPVGDAAAYLGVESQFTFSDILDAISRSDLSILSTFMTVGHGVSVLSVPQQLRTGQIPLKDAVAKLLHVASRTFTHTIIDLPSSLDSDLLNVIGKNCESMFFVLTPELPPLWRSYRLMAHLNEMGYGERVRLILNRDGGSAEVDAREIKKFLKLPIYYRLPNDYKNSIQAISKGTPVVLMKNSRLASSYRKFTQKLAGIDTEKKHRAFLQRTMLRNAG